MSPACRASLGTRRLQNGDTCACRAGACMPLAIDLCKAPRVRRSASIDSAGLPAPARAMTWDAMANVGRIERDVMKSGRRRFRLDFGRLDGKRMRVNSIPSPAGNGIRLPISDEVTAQRVLDAIRAE